MLHGSPFPPVTWTGRKAEDRRRRCRCRIPEEEHHRPGWQFALDMLDELAGIGRPPS
ncbi:transposase [Streptomyces sp. BR123]|uniref:transposase n=1 Tax=Streptomyces sp. BR123 TaxID=2749828 RepID=UPI0015C4B5E4|nr:transposase [Streptomyces sp. BR123]